jgi:hypothetical protein
VNRPLVSQCEPALAIEPGRDVVRHVIDHELRVIGLIDDAQRADREMNANRQPVEGSAWPQRLVRRPQAARHCKARRVAVDR